MESLILYHTLDIAKTAQWHSRQLSLELIGVQYLCTSFSLRSSLTNDSRSLASSSRWTAGVLATSRAHRGRRLTYGRIRTLS